MNAIAAKNEGIGEQEASGNKKPQPKEKLTKENPKKIKDEKGPAGGRGAGGGRGGGRGNSDQRGGTSTAPSKRGNQTTSSTSSSSAPPPRLALFDHLHKPRDANSRYLSIQTEYEVHPSIERFGLFSKSGIFNSDDDRAEAFLMAIIEVIETYTTPQSVALKNDLLRLIKHQVNYLVQHSRVHSMGMGNIIKYIYYILSNVSVELSEADAKSHLINEVQMFHEEKISLARKSICRHFQEIIKEGEVIVTYGSSPLIRSMLISLIHQKKSIRVIIIDSMPQWEGLRTLQSLQHSQQVLSHHHGHHGDDVATPNQKISFVYAPLSGAANAIKDSSRVILGASGLLSNGSVFAPAGTGMIACLAHFYRIPVIVAAESYKFTDKVQMDSIIYNELSDPLQLMKLAPPPIASIPPSSSAPASSSQSNQSKHAIYLPRERHESDRANQEPLQGESDSPLLPPRVQLLNINYDLTPIHNVSAILTEVGLIPPTSIPVLLRELKYDVNA